MGDSKRTSPLQHPGLWRADSGCGSAQRQRDQLHKVTLIKKKVSCHNKWSGFTYSESHLWLPSYKIVMYLDVFRFSTDEGQCWKTFNFTDHPLFLAGLASEPSSRTMNISIFGYRLDDNHQPMWVAVTIDFEHLLTRECKELFKNYGQNYCKR